MTNHINQTRRPNCSQSKIRTKTILSLLVFILFPNLILEEDELVGPKREDQRSTKELREEEARGSTSCCSGYNKSHSFENSKESTSKQRHEHSSRNHECLHKNIHQRISDKNLNCVTTCVNLQVISATTHKI